MTSAEIRQSFLDFFASKQHEIVPSASLMPTAPNLLFTNAGMNQFVPYFLGERDAPYPRAADTQKCIRAGGKHNDLDDVGKDGYHHTYFEMLGNWSFGDYFKEEAIAWAWELITEVWKFPKERLYASVYKPGEGDPANFDQEAYDFWKAIFEKAGLDPEVHIVYGNKKDNFWMMGDTGPCGPCSELHIDLTPAGDTKGKLVNADSPWCIEIWNLVFIQFNATPGGDFVPLKAKHVDTGMGFERVAGILSTTKNFTDFSKPPSNYESDLFGDLFTVIGGMAGIQYGHTLPEDPYRKFSEEEEKDMVFRVLADHIRTLSFSIADGILPGNEGRNYVLRRILRRAVMYGRNKLGLEDGFFAKLVDPLCDKMGGFFPELNDQREIIRKVITSEEQAFGKTLERGMQEFERIAEDIEKAYELMNQANQMDATRPPMGLKVMRKEIGGKEAFKLYDTYGFPLDLTEILAQERGLKIDKAGFETEMEKQRERARASQKKEVIEVADDESAKYNKFVGYERDNLQDFPTTIRNVSGKDGTVERFSLDATPLYAEMGGQVGDIGHISLMGQTYPITGCVKDSAGNMLHQVEIKDLSVTEIVGEYAKVSVDIPRRRAIERHHTATHILHWALREVLGKHVRQAGSYVGPDRLRFDFSHFEQMTKEEMQSVERLCNERIIENSKVHWEEVPFDDKPENTIANFGEKYGNVVRVVDIGNTGTLGSGYSVELCGGTHVEMTGELGMIKLVNESAVASGTRRLEACAGGSAYQQARSNAAQLQKMATQLSCTPAEVAERLEQLLEQRAKIERELKQLKQQQTAAAAGDLISDAKTVGDIKVIATVQEADNPNELRDAGVQILKQLGEGVVVVGGVFGPKVTVVALCSPLAISSGHKAGDIICSLTGKLGGKGGGKPDFAMGGGTEPDKLESVLKEYLDTLV